MKETEWRDRLANYIESEGHIVFREVFYKSDNDRGRADLYVKTSPEWPHHGVFPIMVVECKVPENGGLGWIIDSIKQMSRYMSHGNKYRHGGEDLPNPSIALLATEDSFHNGYIYSWNTTLEGNHRTGLCCWKSMTELLVRVLLKQGCSVLQNKQFQSNKGGGPIRIYPLWV